MINHVIFDFDGTLVDSRDLGIELFNKLADKYSLGKIRQEQIEYLRSLPVKEKIRYMGIPYYLIPVLTVEVLRSYHQSIGTLRTFKGISEMVFQLKDKGFKLSIISSNSKHNIKVFLKNNNIDVFDNIFCFTGIFWKDKAVERFIKKYSLNTNELIYIGDEQRDIISCKSNSIKVIAVSWGYDSLELLSSANPDYIAAAPEEIIHLLK